MQAVQHTPQSVQPNFHTECPPTSSTVAHIEQHMPPPNGVRRQVPTPMYVIHTLPYAFGTQVHTNLCAMCAEGIAGCSAPQLLIARQSAQARHFPPE
jgi:hypothetical protein